MSIEQIKEFLSAPQISDIIAYFFVLVLFVMQAFIKKFVKKDNIQTLFKVDTKTEKLDNARADLLSCKEHLKKEREMFEQEKAELKKEVAAVKGEMETIKKTIRLGFGNVESLVKSGLASKIAKTLSEESDSESLNGMEENQHGHDK